MKQKEVKMENNLLILNPQANAMLTKITVLKDETITDLVSLLCVNNQVVQSVACGLIEEDVITVPGTIDQTAITNLILFLRSL